MLEVKVDLRDGAAWGTLDRVITRFEGAAADAAEAAVAAAAADPAFGPLQPDSDGEASDGDGAGAARCHPINCTGFV